MLVSHPQTGSDGTIATVKLGDFAPGEAEPVDRPWQLGGRIVQVSTRKGLVTVETQLEAP